VCVCELVFVCVCGTFADFGGGPLPEEGRMRIWMEATRASALSALLPLEFSHSLSLSV
jgi:hypothetical protein